MVSFLKVPSIPNKSSAVFGEPGRSASLAFDFSCSLNQAEYSSSFFFHWSLREWQKKEIIIKVWQKFIFLTYY